MTALTMLQSIAGYVAGQDTSSASKPILLGTVDPAYVTSTYPTTLPKITFDGESTLSGKRYVVVGSYLPVAGDRVALVPIGTTYAIIGALADTPDTATAGINEYAVTSGSDECSSDSYQDLAGTGSVTSVSFTKRFTNTLLRIDMIATFYSDTASSNTMFGVHIGSTDYDVAVMFQDQAFLRLPAVGTRLLSGFSPGTYTVQGRWKRTSGGGIRRRIDSDRLTITVTEV
jgi:hypothetical protein